MNDQRPAVELGDLGFDGGAHVLVKLALADRAVGDHVVVHGTHPELTHHLAVWCRQQGHRWHASTKTVERGTASGAAWVGARSVPVVRPRSSNTRRADWALAARGAVIEPGGPAPHFALDDRDAVWTDRAAGLYAQAAAAQWDPRAAIDWTTTIDHDPRSSTPSSR